MSEYISASQEEIGKFLPSAQESYLWGKADMQQSWITTQDSHGWGKKSPTTIKMNVYSEIPVSVLMCICWLPFGVFVWLCLGVWWHWRVRGLSMWKTQLEPLPVLLWCPKNLTSRELNSFSYPAELWQLLTVGEKIKIKQYIFYCNTSSADGSLNLSYNDLTNTRKGAGVKKCTRRLHRHN